MDAMLKKLKEKYPDKLCLNNCIGSGASIPLMQYNGFKIHTIVGPTYNIKVTTPMDFYMFKAMLDAKEYEQIKIL